jgi:hypothetical protein
MNRYNVVYMADGEHYQYSCTTGEEAQQILEQLPAINQSTPIGIFDAKTELVHWEPVQQQLYNRSSISEQARLADQFISIAQSLCTQEVREFKVPTPKSEIGVVV